MGLSPLIDKGLFFWGVHGRHVTPIFISVDLDPAGRILGTEAEEGNGLRPVSVNWPRGVDGEEKKAEGIKAREKS